jgi:serine/threonine protein kinase
MADFWRRFEGVTIDDRYRLLNWSSRTQEGARFSAESEEHGQVSVALSTEDAEYDRGALDHPNLLRVFETGRTSLDDESVSFAVTEAADETLADVLTERVLTAAETREVLSEVLNALGWLHSHGQSHGAVSPRNILAVGDTVKLAPVARHVGEAGPGTPYDPPEGGVSPAGDVWSLGISMYESLMQRLPSGEQDIPELPEPFRRIAEHTLVADPTARWSVDQISAHLSSSSAIQPPVEVVPEPATPVPSLIPAAGKPSGIPAKWVYAALSVAGLSVVAVALWPSGQSRTPAAPATPVPVASRPAPPAQGAVTEAPVVQKPSPYTPPSSAPPAARPAVDSAARQERPYWRLIVYTFSDREHAAQRVAALNKQHPAFKAAVFTPSGSAPYLVALGGRMSREDAAQLRARARGQGLPRDSYIQNYAK